MQKAVPGAVLLDVVEHDWALWFGIAQLAFWKLTFHAPPYMGSTLALQKLVAVDGRVLHNMFDCAACIASEDISRLCLRGHNAPGALCVDTSPRSVPQVFRKEVALRPALLVFLRGAARACARVQHRLVYGMTSLGGLLARADLAADVRGCARQPPLVLHVRGEVRGQLDGAAVVAKDQLLVVVLLPSKCMAFMAQLVAAFEAGQICAQGDAFFPHFSEFIRSGAQVWTSGWHVCFHGPESAFVVGIATYATRQAHTEGPLRFNHLGSIFCAFLFRLVPVPHRLLSGHCATQDLQ